MKALRAANSKSAQGKAKYDRLCWGLSREEVQERISRGEPYVIRLKVPFGTTKLRDLVYGKMEFNNRNVDDQVLIKADGFPTYHFANVVDDYEM